MFQRFRQFPSNCLILPNVALPLPAPEPMPIDSQDRLFEICQAVYRASTQRHSPRDSLAAARYLIEALTGLGVRLLYPIATLVWVYNPQLYKRMGQTGINPDRVTLRQWHQEDGSWRIGVGAMPEIKAKVPKDKVVNDHICLVAQVNGRWWLFDPTISTASRPRFRIQLFEVVEPIDQAFLNGTERLLLQQNDCLLTYERVPLQPHSLHQDRWKMDSASRQAVWAQMVISGAV